MKRILTTETHPELFGVEWPDLLVTTGLCESKAEARRLIKQGGIRIDGIPAPQELAIGRWFLLDADGVIISRGKRRYARIIPIGECVIEIDDEATR